MKKIILSLLLITTVLLSLSCDEKIEDYISKDFCNYEFTKNNPHLFMDMYNILFVSDLNSVKGKIVKREYLKYEIYKPGKTRCGDAERSLSYRYYFFDKKGRVYKEIWFSIYDNNLIGDKKEKNYTFNKKEIIKKEIIYPEIWKSNKNIKVKEEKILKCNDENNCYVLKTDTGKELKFLTGKIICSTNDEEEIIEYTKDNFVYSIYNISDFNKNLSDEKEYKNNVLYKDLIIKFPVSEKLYNDDTVIYNFIKDSGETKTYKRFLVREFYDSGLLKYEAITPKKDSMEELGDYNFTKIEILDKEDDLLKQFYEDIK